MIEIRRATVEDAELISRLIEHVHQVHVEARPDFFKPYVFTQELVASFRERLTDETLYGLIGEVEGAAVGYVLAQVIEHAEDAYTYASRHLHVEQISINPGQRSKGYGEALMRAVTELAQSLEITRVALGVWAFNQRAIAFYERQGFMVRDMRMELDLS